MKTKLTTLLLLLAVTCSAQTFKFVSEDVNDMRTIADSIALNAKKAYKFSSETPIKGSYITRIRYVSPSDSTDRLTVFYSKTMKGANPALELNGTPEYSFHTAFGKFFDLFAFWNKFFDRKAQADTASQQMNEATVMNKRFYFRESESSGLWEISMH